MSANHIKNNENRRSNQKLEKTISFYCKRNAIFTENCLYKYKAGNERDIICFLENKLWVPNILSLNDPQECNVYFNSGNSDLDRKNKNLLVHHLNNTYVLCFSSCPNTICFNYYGNGYKGFCLVYEEEVLNSLFSYPGSCFCKSGDIVYGRPPENIISTNKITTDFIFNKLLEKTIEWNIEFEKRYIFYDAFNEESGFYISNLVPKAIIVGYKMDYFKKLLIKEHCDKCDIEFILCYKGNQNYPLNVGYRKIAKGMQLDDD